MAELRIGHGYDVHRMERDLNLVIGGVQIPYEKGFVAHSDGDVLIHALCDALFGALALGDIGSHFPDSDPAYKEIDSMQLLGETVKIVKEKGYRLLNADMTVILQKPRLRPYIDQMRARIAEVMSVEIECISVKATTEEGLGFTGSESGASAHAVVLLTK